MRSRVQSGCRTSPRGANSAKYGLMSSTGVPSIASNPRTSITPPGRTAISSHTVVPMRFGRALARWARIPTFGHSVLPRGCRAASSTSAGSTRSNTYTTSTWENRNSPLVASSPSSERSSSIELLTRSQSSSTGSVRSLRTTPMGVIAKVIATFLRVEPPVAADVVARSAGDDQARFVGRDRRGAFVAVARQGDLGPGHLDLVLDLGDDDNGLEVGADLAGIDHRDEADVSQPLVDRRTHDRAHRHAAEVEQDVDVLTL